MKPYHRHLVITISLVIAVLILSTPSSSAQGACSTPLPRPPRQGGGRGMASVFGVQAVISYSNPILGCSHRNDSYTNEWIMIIGPGNRLPDNPEWIQVGWERSHGHETIHFWYQYIGPGPNYCTQTPPIVCIPHDQPIDPIQYPVSQARTFRIEAISDEGGSTTWLLWADTILLGAIAADDLGWSEGAQYGSDVQWSGEVSYLESEMGGPACQ